MTSTFASVFARRSMALLRIGTEPSRQPLQLAAARAVTVSTSSRQSARSACRSA
ncbi:MAG: hypothetical protein ABW039_01100 [Sphingobium sp.]